MTAYFNNHFFFKTYINELVLLGGVESQKLMTEKASDCVLTINERNDTEC